MLSSARGFLPYSTEYLQEIDGGSNGDGPVSEPVVDTVPVSVTKKSKKRKQNASVPIMRGVQTISVDDCTFGRFNAIPLTDDGLNYVIATSEANAVLFFSGFGSITLMRGTMNIDGYDVSIGEELSLLRSSWMPAIRLTCTGEVATHTYYNAFGQSYVSTKPGPVKLNSRLPRSAKERINHLRMTGMKCCFVVQGIREDEQEWLVQLEDKSMFAADSPVAVQETTVETEGASNRPSWQAVDTIGCRSAVIGTASALARRGLELMQLPPTWVSACDLQLTQHCLARTSSTSIHSPIVSVICGAKGAGKSSFLRYMLHRLLSYSRCITALPATSSSSSAATTTSSSLVQCCVIDCDLGQPELSIPGVLTLSVVTQPLLSAVPFKTLGDELPHDRGDVPFRSRKVLSLFIGDITSRFEPELFYEALKSLRQEYLRLQEDYRSRIESALGSALGKDPATSVRASMCNNMYSLLDDMDSSDEDIAPEENLSGSARKKMATKHNPGTPKSSENMKIAQADARWSLPLLVNTDGNVQYMGAEILSAVVEIFQPSALCHVAPARSRPPAAIDSLRRTVIQSGGRFLAVERGREGASKTAPIDLRSLRLISYFLRSVHSREMIFPLRLQPRLSNSGSGSSMDWRPEVDANEMDDKNIEPTSKKVEEEQQQQQQVGLQNEESLYIKQARFVGAEENASLALSLLRHGVCIDVPWNRITFHTQDSSHVSHSIFSTINGKIVSVTCATDIDDPPLSVQHLRCRAAGQEFSLSFTSQPTALRCDSLAIVRCIDIAKQRLVLLFPAGFDESPLSSLLVSGSGSAHVLLSTATNLQVPAALTHGTGLPVHSYQSSALCGEGGAPTKTRAAVKRRMS